MPLKAHLHSIFDGRFDMQQRLFLYTFCISRYSLAISLLLQTINLIEFTYRFFHNHSPNSIPNTNLLNERRNDLHFESEWLKCVGLTRLQSPQEHWPNQAALLKSLDSVPIQSWSPRNDYYVLLYLSLNCKHSNASRASPQNYDKLINTPSFEKKSLTPSF